jgi:trehalose-6-phosphate synthase
VNPYDTDATAACMIRALTMPLEERQERWAAMMARVDENTVESWCASFVEALAADAPLSPEAIAAGREVELIATGRPASGRRVRGPWTTSKN